MDTKNSCAILGHSPMRFCWGFDEEDPKCQTLKLVLMQQIQLLYQQGVTDFWVACDPGVGLWAAEIINTLRNDNPDLHLYCRVPYEEVATKWAPQLRERYFTMLEQCTHITCESPHKEPESQLKAFQHIIDQSQWVLTVYDRQSYRNDFVDQAMKYAQLKQKSILQIHPDNFYIVDVQGGTIIERDFLTPFIQEVKREASVDHTLYSKKRTAFLRAVAKAEEDYKQLNLKKSQKKQLEFEAFEPMLIAFAKKNCAYLKINGENPLLIEVELKFAVVLGDFNYYLISGGTLSRIFNLYRYFSLDVSSDNYVRLQFMVPLIDVEEIS